MEKRVKMLKTEKRRFLTFHKMRLTMRKRILVVQTKLEKLKKSQTVKQKTWLQNGYRRIQDCPQRPKWKTMKLTTLPSANGVRSAWQAEARESSTAPV